MASLMVIDDETDTLTLLKNIFQKNGLDVHTSSTGSRAVQNAEKYTPDVLLLDVNLDYPYDGRSICEQLKANEKTKNIKIFLCSSDYAGNNLREFHEDGFIQKPFNINELKKIIMPVMNRHP